MKVSKTHPGIEVKNLEEGISDSRVTLLKSISRKMEAFKKCSLKKDRREMVACILCAGLFGIYFFMTPSVLKKTGSLIIILAALIFSYKLYKVSRELAKKKPPLEEETLQNQLVGELHKIKRWKKLLENIGRWYILPLSCGLFLLTVGSQSSLLFKINYFLIVGASGGVFWYLHQRRVSYKLEPLIFELKQAIRFERYSGT